ncbi:hypothetical protein MAQ58_24400, partial [Enterobacter sp. DRP3]|nr:hypothetical protein [Enterobacter sp. DRP3]
GVQVDRSPQRQTCRSTRAQAALRPRDRNQTISLASHDLFNFAGTETVLSGNQDITPISTDLPAVNLRH